jgi:dienelactone hydrolase
MQRLSRRAVLAGAGALAVGSGSFEVGTGTGGRLRAAEPVAQGPIERGVVEAPVEAIDAKAPELFRLEPARFAYELAPFATESTKFAPGLLTFPSPLVTESERNNTVHGEYFRSLEAGPRPAAIVLHILGGDFDLARLFARSLAHHGVQALFVKMPYYGPRRDPASPRRMISPDPRETVAGMRQAVLDIRRAVRWLGSRPEVDPARLGVFGISLGGITSGLAAGAEPRLQNVCMMLAGGDLGQVSWRAREMEPLRKKWESEGGTQETFKRLMAQVDPMTYAERVKGRRILMLNADQDEVIPPECTRSLWRALGEPEIHWYPAGHYSAIRFIFDGVARVTRFFQSSAARAAA